MAFVSMDTIQTVMDQELSNETRAQERWLKEVPKGDAEAQDRPARQRSRSPFLAALNWFFKLLLPLMVIAAGAFAAWQLVATKPEVNKRPAREKAYAVQVTPAMPSTQRPDILLYGTISAARTVDLRALVGGEVNWVSPDLVVGRIVKERDPLIRIDSFDYEGGVREAEANLAEARAKLTETMASITSDESALERLIEQQSFAASDLERAETLVESGSLTRQALENRKLVLSQRQQSVEARQNNLTVLKARIEQQQANLERLTWRLEQARRDLADTTLKAPFTGIVQTKSVDLGRSVSGNDTLVSLYDPDQMDVRFTLSDAQYGRLISDNQPLEGREITVNWTLGDMVQIHAATIERITPEVNAANGGIEVYARIAAGSNLRAGAFVELVVPDKSYDNVVTIPQAAIYNGNQLFINKDGRMEPVEVSILAYLGTNVLVDGAAFEEGTEIITTRIAEAGPGLKLFIPGREQAGKSREAGKQARGAGKGGEGEQNRGQGGAQ